MRIKKIDKEQLAEIASMEQTVFSDAWSEKGLADTLSQPQAVLFGVWDADALTGYVILYYVLDECEIARIAVKQEARRKGAATELLRAVLQFCEENNIERLMLDVRESNLPALAFYKKNGFVQDGIRKRFYTDPVEDAILMSRKVNE